MIGLRRPPKMKKNFISLLIITSIFFFSACAPKARVWYKAGASQENLQLELAQCRYEVELATPNSLDYYDYTHLVPHWYYSGYYYHGHDDDDDDHYHHRDVERFWARVAAREAIREAEYQRYYRVKRLTELCMEVKGWQLIPEDVLSEYLEPVAVDAPPESEGRIY